MRHVFSTSFGKISRAYGDNEGSGQTGKAYTAPDDIQDMP